MGMLKRLNMHLKIKTQFVLYFLLCFIVSVIITLLFLGIALFVFENKKVANAIENYAVINGDKILNVNFQDELNKQIPKDDIEYWIVSNNKKVLYTSAKIKKLPEDLTISSKEYYGKEYNNATYGISFKPFFSEGKFQGGIVLRYKSNIFVESSIINTLLKKINYNVFFFFFILFPIFVICPFIIILIFSVLFSKDIIRPLKEMIKLSNHIKNGRLDFIIDTSYTNELGQVLKSFEDMRITLQKSLKAQWMMEEQRKDMILSLTHDIKTPITIINGHLELLAGSYNHISEENRKTYINIMLSNSEKIKKMINELNEIWDLERPNFTLNIQKVDLNDYILELEGDYIYICAKKNVNFRIISSLSPGGKFDFDSFRINEVLQNIITNSLKHTEDNGEIILEIYLENSNLIFRVSDNGKGFNEEVDLVFNKYYKGNGDLIYKNSSGLGLYICKLIIEKHGGEISAYNNKREGATIEFSLPGKDKLIEDDECSDIV
ncbi:HAMP domain-containing sensor histidine kinase [Bacillus thuringiensis]|uniref:HAMP domain-containing sensor histidine kinase n=1 Tax=Bacillus thuringiensis TaxID=1428 RepID=UPI0011A8AD17|nr:HAMP domain-containing sensor histidine kinase [Bacillus thuringiensis]